LVGQVGRVGDHLMLTAELIDVESGQTLASTREEASSATELFSLAGAIGAEVRDRLGSTEGDSEGAFDLARALTSSPEAYRQYAAGEIALHQMDWPEAIERFGRAIQEDPTFALAYYRMAFVQDWYGDAEGARTSLDKGLPHIDRLPARWQAMYRAYQDYSQNDIQQAHGALTELIQSSPDLPDAYYTLGELTVHLSRYRDYRKARQLFERVLEIDPTYKVVFFHLIQCYIFGDDIPAARRLIERYRAEDPNDPAVIRAETTLLAAEGRSNEAIARIEASAVEPEANLYLLAGKWERAFTLADEDFRGLPGYEGAIGLQERGLAQAGRGRLKDALADLNNAGNLLSGGTLVSYLGVLWHIQRALLLEATGNVDGAVGAARDAIALDPLALEGTFHLGRILLAAGKRADAEEALASLQKRRQESQSPSGEFWEHLLQAEIELAEGNLPAATAALEQASSLPPEYRDRVAEGFTKARLRVASGDRSGAIAAYREVLKPSAQWAGSPVDSTLALYELARLEDQAGDVASARGHYQEVIDRWGDADLPVPLVGEAKERMAALTL
jgi:tetratricopeptide (TPR) repeat protein